MRVVIDTNLLVSAITGDGDFSEAKALIATHILSVRAFARAVAPQTLVASEGS